MRKEDGRPSTNLFQPLKCVFTVQPSPFTLYPSLLAILVVAAQSGAVPQPSSLPTVQSHEVRRHAVSPALQPHANRSPVMASGDESRDASKTFVDMAPAELAKA